MVKAFLDRYILACYIEFLSTFQADSHEKEMFTKLALISIHSQLIEDSRIFTSVLDEAKIEYLKESVISLNKELKNDIVVITYALPYSEKLYGVIAHPENMYQRIMKSVRETPGCLERPDEWKYLYKL
uniref:Acyl-CoA oxidase C-terminal domain-containing protein n=1 Tax=Euplotes harpa TaxID=151035 RepID=A0A7S3N5B5_9SPIT|mmetsp:Transcript_12778/g.14576  ORF Transcript_12778/g.14576 Transcript_12778/m.14576 type:complete len:128 (+) Transcript_12778:1090-1473(+)